VSRRATVGLSALLLVLVGIGAMWSRSEPRSQRALDAHDSDTGAPGLAPLGAPTRRDDSSQTRDLRLAFKYPSLERLRDCRLLVTLRPEQGREKRFRLRTHGRDLGVTLFARGAGQLQIEDSWDGTSTTVRATLSGLPAGRYELEAETDDPLEPQLHARGTSVDFPAQTELTVPLLVTGDRSSYLFCRVLRGSEAADRAEIHVTVGGRRVDRLNTSEGRTRITELPPGPYSVKVVRFPGSDPRSLPPSQEVMLAAGEIRELVFQLPEPTAVRFTAVDKDGTRCAFSLSVWRLDVADSPLYMNVTALFRRAPGGRLWSGHLLPGEYAAKLSPKRQHGTAWTQFVVAPGLPIEEEVVLNDDGVRLHVRIVQRGAPVSKVRLNVNRLTDELFETANWLGMTTSDGIAVTSLLPPGDYLIWLWDQKRVRRLTLGSAPDPAVTISLDAPASTVERTEGVRVDVRLSNNDGEVARDVIVVALGVDEPDGNPLHVFARVSGDSVYHFEGLPPGHYRFWVPYSIYRRVKYREFTSDAVEVRRQEPTQEFSFRLRR